MATDPITEHPRLRALIEQGEEAGCVNLSDFSELVQELELDDDVLGEIQDEFDRRRLNVTDDCGNGKIEPTRVRADDFAANTTDALQLFLNEVRRHPLLSATEDVWLTRALAPLVAMRARREQQGAQRVGVGGGHAAIVMRRFPC